MWRRVYFSPVSSLEKQGYQLRSQSDLLCQVMAYRIGRGGRGGRRPVANAEVLRLMQRLEARLDVIEGDKQRDLDDASEDEEPQEEEPATQESAELKLLKQVLGSTSRPKPDVSNYSGGLNPGELVDWINDMEKFFDYEEMNEEKKVKFAVKKLKGHASLWWDGVQAERRRQNKQKIKSWNRMTAKLRGKFLPQDY